MAAIGNRILLIDHEGKVRNSLSRLLTRNAFDVSTAQNGQKALRRLRRGEEFDCVIMDVLMPDMFGRDFVQAVLAEKLIDLKHLLVLTAVQNADNATAYLQAGVSGYCVKPFENEWILEQVKRACMDGNREPGFNPIL